MSDLAPFVASVLRDRVVDELKEENDQLRQILRDTQRVELCSWMMNDEDDNHGQIKVHAVVYLENGNMDEEEEDGEEDATEENEMAFWTIPISSSSDNDKDPSTPQQEKEPHHPSTSFSLQELQNMFLTLGGTCVDRVSPESPFVHFFNYEDTLYYDTETQCGKMSMEFHRTCPIRLTLEFGPLAGHEYQNLVQTLDGEFGHVVTQERLAFQNDDSKLRFTPTEISFPVSSILPALKRCRLLPKKYEHMEHRPTIT